MGLKEMMERFVSKNERFKEIKDEQQFRDKLASRNMSADERELARYLKENREARIKSEVKKIRDRKSKEMWHGKTALDAKNIFKGDKNIFRRESMFEDYKKKEKRLFFQ